MGTVSREEEASGLAKHGVQTEGQGIEKTIDSKGGTRLAKTVLVVEDSNRDKDMIITDSKKVAEDFGARLQEIDDDLSIDPIISNLNNSGP